MNLGAEPKKVMVLAGLIVIAGISLYINSGGDSNPAPVTRTAPTPVPATATVANSKSTTTLRARGGGRMASTEFRPRVGGTRPEDRIDPASIDPELRLDLLAKVQAIEPVAAGRNLFQFGAAPPPAALLPAVPKGVPKILINQAPPRPQQMAVMAPPPSGPPPAPPINLKYYGFDVSKDGRKQAFLLDGDDIILAAENQTVKQHYRIVRIALGEIVVEDTQSRSTQTLKLQDIPG